MYPSHSDNMHVPRALRLAELAQLIGNALRLTPALQDTWVTAELSDVRRSGGHCYMELVEKNSQGQTVAKVRATIWASSYAALNGRFAAATGRDISTGLKVMVRGTAQHHPVYGLSFNITGIDPSYTLGDMERLRREILERLHREGVLALNKSMPMPVAPQRVAVISAPGAAGYGDFVRQLNDNPYGFVFYSCLFAATMQGDRTSASVREALDRIEQTIDLWDCVAIVRGGGATTDLNGFDDYELARRVATFPLPIAVGIGHERDRTVLDEIAHTRLKTPTAVAAHLTALLHGAMTRAQTAAQTAVGYASERLNGEYRRLSAAEPMIAALGRMRVAEARTRLTQLTSRIPSLAQTRVGAARALLDSRAQAVAAEGRHRIAMALHDTDTRRDRLTAAAAAAVVRHGERLEALGRLVNVLSPDNTLRRGYSITRVDGHAVTDASRLSPGTLVETRLRTGTIRSTVISASDASDA